MEQKEFIRGLGIIKFEGRVTVPAGQEIKALDAVISDSLKKDEIFQQWRGQIINNSLFLEERLSLFLKELLSESEKDKLIGLSFKNKTNLLKDLLKKIDSVKDLDLSELFLNVSKVIEERNKFAHGQVNYSGLHGENILLSNFKDNTKEEITEELIIKIILLCTKCHQKLEYIIDLIKKSLNSTCLKKETENI